MHVKVRDATAPNSDASLCSSCRHSTITRGRRLDEELVQCHAAPMSYERITFKVTSCTGYDDERLPTYMQMFEQAWILQPGSKRRPAGFVRARDLQEEEVPGMFVSRRPRED